jgi:hypothetical protein
MRYKKNTHHFRENLSNLLVKALPRVVNCYTANAEISRLRTTQRLITDDKYGLLLCLTAGPILLIYTYHALQTSTFWCNKSCRSAVSTIYVMQSLLNVDVIIYQSPSYHPQISKQTNKNKLRGFSTQANYTGRATAACRRS